MWLLRGQRVIQVSFRHDEVTLSSNEMVLFLFVAFAFSHSYYIRELCVGSACILEEILETNNVIKNLSVEKNCSSFFPSLELVIIAFVAMIAVELSKHLSKKGEEKIDKRKTTRTGRWRQWGKLLRFLTKKMLLLEEYLKNRDYHKNNALVTNNPLPQKWKILSHKEILSLKRCAIDNNLHTNLFQIFLSS